MPVAGLTKYTRTLAGNLLIHFINHATSTLATVCFRGGFGGGGMAPWRNIFYNAVPFCGPRLLCYNEALLYIHKQNNPVTLITKVTQNISNQSHISRWSERWKSGILKMVQM